MCYFHYKGFLSISSPIANTINIIMEVPVYDVVVEKKVTSLPGECPERYSMKTNELYSAMKEIYNK